MKEQTSYGAGNFTLSFQETVICLLSERKTKPRLNWFTFHIYWLTSVLASTILSLSYIQDYINRGIYEDASYLIQYNKIQYSTIKFYFKTSKA